MLGFNFNTPLEKYKCGEQDVWVKRDDHRGLKWKVYDKY